MHGEIEQRPPLTQGELEHGVIEQLKPEYPGAQVQAKELPLIAQAPPFAQGELKQGLMAQVAPE